MKWGEEIKLKFDLTLGMDEFPGDLLPNSIPNCVKLEVMEKEEEEEEEEEMELSLGLSMNGRFGVDPSSKKFKSSSFLTNLVSTAESSGRELTRTSSLPTAAEEWRRRKEWLNNRRLEARKKRMEKLKNLRALKGNGNVESGDGYCLNRTQSTISMSATADLNLKETKQVSKTDHLQRVDSNSKVSEPEKSVTEMPYVSTKGEGMNKVDGFLYRYKKGEDVRIVCVCHGLFLSPAEFVKHGGGGDVQNPLKHIVVNPFPLV